MCHKVEADFILIRKLKNNNSCTVSQLVEDKNQIEELYPNLFVDVSKGSIYSSVCNHPRIFGLDGDKIIKAKDSDNFYKEPIINYFDNNLEEPLILKIEKVLSGTHG